MSELLGGKSILVTGGASGIGRAAAQVMAREGARVAVADRAEAGARETVRLIEAAGGRAVALQADVTRSDQVQAMVKAAVAAFGRLDCAFNNAGISPAYVGGSGLATADVTEEVWNQVIAVNLTGVWLCMKYEIAQMLTQGGGATVNTASVAGLRALPNACSYVASKHGVIGLTKAAAMEYGSGRIRVNAICPGWVRTPMTEEVRNTRGDALVLTTPLHRVSEPEEIAETVAWLCSDRASYTTGAAYTADGGLTA